MPGITLFLQPVQDLTIEDRVSRTQFQFIMEDPDADRLSEWVPRLIDRLKQSPELQDVASDLQDRGLQAFLDIDRDAAGRLGISVSAIDDALYDAFGQRLISTIYTQANQYRVVLEAARSTRSVQRRSARFTSPRSRRPRASSAMASGIARPPTSGVVSTPPSRCRSRASLASSSATRGSSSITPASSRR